MPPRTRAAMRQLGEQPLPAMDFGRRRRRGAPPQPRAQPQPQPPLPLPLPPQAQPPPPHPPPPPPPQPQPPPSTRKLTTCIKFILALLLLSLAVRIDTTQHNADNAPSDLLPLLPYGPLAVHNDLLGLCAAYATITLWPPIYPPDKQPLEWSGPEFGDDIESCFNRPLTRITLRILDEFGDFWSDAAGVTMSPEWQHPETTVFNRVLWKADFEKRIHDLFRFEILRGGRGERKRACDNRSNRTHVDLHHLACDLAEQVEHVFSQHNSHESMRLQPFEESDRHDPGPGRGSGAHRNLFYQFRRCYFDNLSDSLSPLFLQEWNASKHDQAERLLPPWGGSWADDPDRWQQWSAEHVEKLLHEFRPEAHLDPLSALRGLQHLMSRDSVPPSGLPGLVCPGRLKQYVEPWVQKLRRFVSKMDALLDEDAHMQLLRRLMSHLLVHQVAKAEPQHAPTWYQTILRAMGRPPPAPEPPHWLVDAIAYLDDLTAKLSEAANHLDTLAQGYEALFTCEDALNMQIHQLLEVATSGSEGDWVQDGSQEYQYTTTTRTKTWDRHRPFERLDWVRLLKSKEASTRPGLESCELVHDFHPDRLNNSRQVNSRRPDAPRTNAREHDEDPKQDQERVTSARREYVMSSRYILDFTQLIRAFMREQEKWERYFRGL